MRERNRRQGHGLSTIVVLALVASAVGCGRESEISQAAEDKPTTSLDPRRAFSYLQKITRIGPRFSGSQGMAEQQRVISKHFSDLGAKVGFQAFDAAHPQTGRPVRMNNIIVSWHPESKKRVLLACHYDTRPFPDRDRVRPRGRFVGANDGASGVALFMEMGHHMKSLKPSEGYGVDFVFFDGEELVFDDEDKYFLGSEYFSHQYRDKPPAHRYVYGILVDMIGDRRLNLYMEKKSAEKFAPALTRSIWSTAKRLGVREFIGRVKHDVNDDHVPLNEIARIPTCDIIDFDYPYWHTTRDVETNCSGGSLAKVGRVLLVWLTEIPHPTER